MVSEGRSVLLPLAYLLRTHTQTRDLLFCRVSWAETNYSPSPWKSSLFLSKLCAAQRGTGETKTPTVPRPEQEKGSTARGGCRTLEQASALLYSSLGPAPATQQFSSPRTRHYRAPFSSTPKHPSAKPYTGTFAPPPCCHQEMRWKLL